MFKLPIKKIKYYIRRYPFFYKFRYFLILKIGEQKLFESENANRYCPPEKIPKDFLYKIATIDRPEDKPFQAAINIAYNLSHGHQRMRGLGYAPSATLKMIYGGKGGICSDYSQVFVGLCIAANIKVREWGFSADNFRWDKGHAFCEIFSTEYKKWVFIDPLKSFWVSLKSNNTPLNVIELINLSERDLTSSINLKGIDKDQFNTYRSSILGLYNFSKNIFFLLSDNKIFDQAKFLRYAKIVPLPILHLLMIIFGCYQSFNIYLPPAREKEILHIYKKAKRLF